jgi:hypothetical protein
MMVVIAVIGIVVVIAATEGRSVYRQYRWSGFLRSVTHALNVARMRAVMKGAPVTLRFEGIQFSAGLPPELREIRGNTYMLQELEEEDAGVTKATTVSGDLIFWYDSSWYNIIVEPMTSCVVDYAAGTEEIRKNVRFVARGYTRDFRDYTLTVTSWKHKKPIGWADPFDPATEKPVDDPAVNPDLASQTTITVSKLGTLDR